MAAASAGSALPVIFQARTAELRAQVGPAGACGFRRCTRQPRRARYSEEPSSIAPDRRAWRLMEARGRHGCVRGLLRSGVAIGETCADAAARCYPLAGRAFLLGRCSEPRQTGSARGARYLFERDRNRGCAEDPWTSCRRPGRGEQSWTVRRDSQGGALTPPPLPAEPSLGQGTALAFP